jgi:anti-anti-sigma factor
VAAAARGGGVEGLLDVVLRQLVGEGPSDDVAVVAARLVPAPLEMDLIGDAGRLRDVRGAVRQWAGRAALDEDTTDDLLLVVGEAAANAVEHAYGGAPGRLRVRVALVDGARLEGTVADEGRWRPVPADPGSRGRGLTLLRKLTTSVDLDRGPDGTVVRFVVALRPSGSAGPAAGSAPEDRPAEVTVAARNGHRCIEVTGDLDLAGAAAVRDRLLAAVGVPGPLVLDLTGLGALSSSGLGLLLEAARVRPVDVPADVLLPEGGPARRLLDLTGLTDSLRRPR